jgi:hypothetical protein
MTTAEQIRALKLDAHFAPEPASPPENQNLPDDDPDDEPWHNNTSFYFLQDEQQDTFWDLRDRLEQEQQPQDETERILVRRLADHEWLRNRGLRYQRACFSEEHHVLSTEHLALYLRYQTTHERSFYNALKELRTPRAQKKKSQIGFESQKRQEAAAEGANLKTCA